MVTAKLLEDTLTATWRTLDRAGDKLEVIPATDAVDAFTVYITFNVGPDDAVDLHILGVPITTLNYLADTLKCLLSIQLVEENFKVVDDADIRIVTTTEDIEAGPGLITSYCVGTALFLKA